MGDVWRIFDPSAPAPIREHQQSVNRRHFFGEACGLGACGVGVAALANLLTNDRAGAAEPEPAGRGLPGLPHFAPQAKRVIFLFQNGAPTHVDLFDHKPLLTTLHGTPFPDKYFEGKRFSTMTGDPHGKLVLAPVEPFQQYGESGAWVSDLMPHTAQIVDELCFIKSLHTDAVNHAPAISFMLSGANSRTTNDRRLADLWSRLALGELARLRGDDIGHQEHDLRPDLL